MTPRLPANPATISDTQPKASTWTAESVWKRYSHRTANADCARDLQIDLREVQAWDNYERSTSERREAVKAMLNGMVDACAQPGNAREPMHVLVPRPPLQASPQDEGSNSHDHERN